MIVALGKFSGHRVVRINLSEQVCNLFYYFFIFTYCRVSDSYNRSKLSLYCSLTFVFSMHPVMVLWLLVQTDMMDLLGSDLPVESDEGMKFAWSDGILLQVLTAYLEAFTVCSCDMNTWISMILILFSYVQLLQALKEGSWVLLDELNLAPQSVLEAYP